MSRGVAILGSTGSIGTSALKVLARRREEFRVVALTAYGQQERLAGLLLPDLSRAFALLHRS